jgi:nitrite reductase/ring-hydroxylating ferredoxin subunit
MKRADALCVISRRGVCGGIASCLGLALVNCVDGHSTIIETGGLGSDNERADAGIDAPMTIDSGAAATCPPSGANDVGAPTAFALGKPVYQASGNFFVIRDSGGLYAVSARCTHEGVTVIDDGTQLVCKKHGATFTYDGDVTNPPAFFPLVHYEMCALSNGHVGVVISQVVAKTQRLMA